MAYALIALDKPNALDLRMQTRTAHLDYVAETGIVQQGGPFIDEAGDMCGSMIVLDVDTLAEAREWADNDPYAKAGLFASVQLFRWKKVID
ncbi:YciI family protein [Pseudaestuariivita rosea]|uniref:YciI family protein n=1 Tax=Pseudaestuariivita rosea TaxID=2763263 RepID=UPI001ABB8221|nr:YciI family protein [Pseudaestuariivita rosea]